MSTHRYKRSGFINPSRLSKYVPNTPTLVQAGLQFADVNLVSDAGLGDLTEYMATLGYEFVETSPAAAPPEVETGLPIRNETGSTIPANTLVVETGYSVTHSRPLVSVADCRSGALRPTLGVTKSAILNNANGQAFESCVLTGLNTSGFSAINDVLALGTAGDFIRPPPDNVTFPSSGEVQHVGQVQRVHASLGEIKVNIGMSLIQPASFVAEAADAFPYPLTPGLGAQSTRSDQTVLEGGIYRLFRRTTFNRLVIRATAAASSPTLAIGIYQATGGGAGVASRIARATGVALANGAANYQITPVEGSVALEQGVFYVLFGRDSAGGTFSIRTYGIQPYDLLNQQMISGDRPLSFVTTLAANLGLPTTFDPRQSPTGAAVETSINCMPVLRFATV